MPRKPCGDITFSETGKPWKRKMGRSCFSVARMIATVLTYNVEAIKVEVLTELGLDSKTRRVHGNVIMEPDPDPKPGGPTERPISVRNLNWHNRAVALELLAGFMFTCLNDPERVTLACELNEAQTYPKKHAPEGEDVLCSYARGAFEVAVEVSTKQVVSERFFRKQAMQTLRHASALAASGFHEVVYGLIINNGSVELNEDLREIYREVLADELVTDRVRLIPISCLEMQQTFETLAIAETGPGLNFSSGALRSAFDEVYERLRTGFTPEPGWTRETLVAAINASPDGPASRKDSGSSMEIPF